ncbi:mediterrocin family bacteriocin [Paenibacillus sp. MMS18-CY102]|uniref:mediterrocin family bacteriocin n=1 Tax=Paenibacillus sp. MMS18-CY102 TaxID=2682849 RepID=UPI00136623D8|nr:hypothetical protein [Paenibacillus sp. MMS18-CY102]MWC27095.1 hypothetical protein [Paenibacillus sp. MMS18-CY102]
MNKMKSLLLSAFVAVSVLSVSSSAFAATYTYSSSNIGFAHDWELTASGGSGAATWEIEYGYDTAWTNEDYTHTYHNSLSHTAKVLNGATASNEHTDSDSAGSWAGIEVKHSGSLVYYKIVF